MKVHYLPITILILCAFLAQTANAQLVFDREQVEVEVRVDEQEEVNVNVVNNGDEAVAWLAVARTHQNFPADWELVRSIPAGEMLDDSRIQGVAFSDDRFYVAGAGDHEPTIYILDRNGNLIDQFEQPNRHARYGYRDLAFDGELIWGSGNDIITGFTTDGEEAASFEGPYNPNTCFAYDSDLDVLWVSSTTSNISAVDREGNVVRELDRHEQRIYGLAYFPEDPDDSRLYSIARNADRETTVYKFNVENDDTLVAADLNDEFRPSGAYITDEYIPNVWTFMHIVNQVEDDRINIWIMGSGIGWLAIDPVEGALEAQNDIDLFLTFDAQDLVPDLYEGFLSLIYGEEGDAADLPVSMSVVPGVVVANPIDDITVDEDPGRVDIADLDNVFFGQNGEDLEFRFENAPPGLNLEINDDNVLFFDPEENYNLMEGAEIVVTAENDDGAMAEDIFMIVILPVNDAPLVVRAIEDATVDQDPGLVVIDDLSEVFFDADGEALILSHSETPDELNMQITDQEFLIIEPESDFVLPEGALITVFAEDAAGEIVNDDFTLTINPLAVGKNGAELPEGFEIASVYPNPFNAGVTISYRIPERNRVTVSIFDSEGKLIDIVSDSHRQAGVYSATWNANSEPNGLYLVSVQTNTERLSRKVLLVK